MKEPSPNAPDESQQLRMNRWRRRTLRALVVSRVATLAAIGLAVAGVGIYFADFNFGSGGDRRGLTILVAALGLCLIGVIGDLYAIVAAWFTWRHTGSAGWLATAVLFPLMEILAFAVVWRSL